MDTAVCTKSATQKSNVISNNTALPLMALQERSLSIPRITRRRRIIQNINVFYTSGPQPPYRGPVPVGGAFCYRSAQVIIGSHLRRTTTPAPIHTYGQFKVAGGSPRPRVRMSVDTTHADTGRTRDARRSTGTCLFWLQQRSPLSLISVSMTHSKRTLLIKLHTYTHCVLVAP